MRATQDDAPKVSRLVRWTHAALVLSAAVPFMVAYVFLGFALVLVLLAHRLWPKADRGNCWSYVGPRWWTRGGYIMIRPAEDIKVLRVFPIPHAIWVGDIGDDIALRQSAPLDRSRNPWKTLYFKYVVRETERSRATTPGALDSRSNGGRL